MSRTDDVTALVVGSYGGTRQQPWCVLRHDPMVEGVYPKPVVISRHRTKVEARHHLVVLLEEVRR